MLLSSISGNYSRLSWSKWWRNDGLNKLREDVVGRFDGQKFLMVGAESSGKSSLINSFTMVLYLADPDYKWMEWASVGKTDAAVTMLYRKYDPKKLFTKMTPFLGNKTLDLCPTFFDTAGFSGKGNRSEEELLFRLAAGEIPEKRDLRELLQSDEEINFNLFQKPTQNTELQCWSILFVVNVNSDFSNEVAEVCYKAWEKLEKAGKGKQL